LFAYVGDGGGSGGGGGGGGVVMMMNKKLMMMLAVMRGKRQTVAQTKSILYTRFRIHDA